MLFLLGSDDVKTKRVEVSRGEGEGGSVKKGGRGEGDYYVMRGDLEEGGVYYALNYRCSEL